MSAPHPLTEITEGMRRAAASAYEDMAQVTRPENHEKCLNAALSAALAVAAPAHPAEKETPMDETPTPRMQTITTTTRDDVRPGDHIVWENIQKVYGLTITERREGTAHVRDKDGEWKTSKGGWLTNGVGKGITITIRRPVQDLPTEPGTVIVNNDGHEYITATYADVTYRAREAILLAPNHWHAAWRSDEGVLPHVTPERIDTDTWKKGNR